MRKRMKKKLRSCAMCKAHKMGWDQRWKKKDLVALERFETATLHVSRTDSTSEHWDLTA